VKKIAVICILSCLYSLNGLAQTWVRKQDFPSSGRINPLSFTIGNTGYFGNGIISGFSSDSADFFKYDLLTDQWTPIAPLPERFNAAVSFSIGQFGYAGIGYVIQVFNNGYGYKRLRVSSDFFKYDPVLDSWSKQASYPQLDTYNCGSFTLNGTGYVGGGIDSLGSLYTHVFSYDPVNNQWSPQDSLPNALSGPSGFSSNQTGFVCLGSNHGDTLSDKFYQFNPGANSWNTLPNSPLTQFGSRYCSFAADSSVYFCLDSSQFWRYIPSNGLWQRLSNTPFEAAGATMVLHGIPLIIPEGTSEVWQLCPPLHVRVGTDTSICQGMQTRLHASGGLIYSWSPATGLDNPNSMDPLASPSDTTVYIVTVTDSFGCKGVDSLRINIKPVPLIQIVANRTTLCSGDTTQLTASGGSIYSWQPTTGVSNPNLPNPVITPLDTTFYRVSVTNNQGCSSQDSIRIQVLPLPNVQAIATPSTICRGDTTTLKTIGGQFYTWSPTGTLSDSTGSFVKAFPLSNTTYTLTRADNAGCSASVLLQVLVNSLPTISLSAIPQIICSGDTAILSATGSVYYSWTPAKALSSPNGSQVKAFPDSTVTYLVGVTDSTGGCRVDTSLTLIVNSSPPVPWITAASTILTSSALTGNQWYFNGTPVPGAINQSDSVTVNGVYQVCVKNGAGCSSCSSPFPFNSLGVTEFNLTNELILFPNPARTVFTIKFAHEPENDMIIELYNAYGQQVKSIYSGNNTGKIGNQIQVSIAEIPGGLYFVRLRIKNQEVTKSILIEK